ncbi:MAG: AGE family epimerase/isomerase [Candidatus Hodarchaeota archaeon]
MLNDLKLHDMRFKWLKYSHLLLLTFVVSLSCITTPSAVENMIYAEDAPTLEHNLSLKMEDSQEPSITVNSKILAEENPEAYFPNFLYYSITLANVLIDYLYDNTTGGFFRSVDEHWTETSIDTNKYVYDQAQAIIALLKLSDAVINETERDFALDIAEMTGDFLITEFYDNNFGGFYSGSGQFYKRPGIQAKTIQAFLSLYEATGNLTYRDIAINTYNFLDTSEAWELIDQDTGYYVYLLSHSGLVATSNPDSNSLYDPRSKRVDHNVLMGDALLDLYRVELTEKYLTKAKIIYNFFNSTCRNTTTGLYYNGLNENNEIVENTSADIFINSLVLKFLARLYNATEDIKYYDDFITLLNSVLNYFWDSNHGGFFATYSYLDPESRDTKKYAERLFYAIVALDEAYRLTENSLYYNLILDVVEFLNNKLYDNVHEGYFQLVNEDGTLGEPSWRNKYSVTNSLAIFTLSNLWLYSKPGVLNALWSPSTPRPQDSVTILVAAFDADGLSNVLFNYSMNNDPYKLIEMIPHHLVGGMFNTTLDSQLDGTTINFNIIVNDTQGNEIVRGSYFFLWQVDKWGPQIEELGLDPGRDIPVNSRFSITVSAHDVPEQGEVTNVRIYYHAEGESEESKKLERIDLHLWEVEFSDGFGTPGGYIYYFEALDERGNVGYSAVYNIVIQGQLEPISMTLVIGVLFFILFFIPGGLFTYVEYKKKTARKTLKNRRKLRESNRRNTGNSRGTRRRKK